MLTLCHITFVYHLHHSETLEDAATQTAGEYKAARPWTHTHTHTSRNHFTLVAYWKTFSYKCPLNGRQACRAIVGAPNINHMTAMVRPVINTLNGDVTWLADSERQQKRLHQQVSFPTAAKLSRRLDKALNDRCDCLPPNECRSCKYCVYGGG